MSDLIWLSQAQMRRIEPYFPLSHGVPRVDDRRVISGIIFVVRNGLRWRDAPKDYGPHKTIYNRFIRWSRLGVFNRIIAALAAKGGKPDQWLVMLLSEGQMSDYKGAALMIDALPRAKALLGDRGYDADWFRQALTTRGITPCIPSKSNRKLPIPYDRVLYRQRHRIENMFGRLKDWRRIHTRYDRCAHTFMSAICIAATVIFWL
jgi:transposase